MLEVFRTLNQLKKKGIVKNYAIGGGIAALAYIEPVLTYDIDVFVILRPQQGKILLLTPIYDYLKSLGYNQRKGEHVIIGGQPVQFIPADELEAEAITSARTRVYQNVRVRLMGPEYLIALLARVGRPKDIVKVRMLQGEAKIDKNKLKRILVRYNLVTRYGSL